MPFIPPAVRMLLSIMAPALLAVAGILPAPVGPILCILGYVGAGIVGLSVSPPKIVAGKSYVPAGLAAMLLSLIPFIQSFAAGQQGMVKLALEALVMLCVFLAGNVVPVERSAAPHIIPKDGMEAAKQLALNLASKVDANGSPISEE